MLASPAQPGLAAGVGTGEYSSDLWFLDSDLYKWLEAVGWTFADPELCAEAAARLEEQVDTSWKLLAQAQAEDGYLDSYFQVRYPALGSRTCSGATSATARAT